MDGIENAHMTSQIHLAQKWPSKYFPDRLENLKSVHQKLVAQQRRFFITQLFLLKWHEVGGKSTF